MRVRTTGIGAVLAAVTALAIAAAGCGGSSSGGNSGGGTGDEGKPQHGGSVVIDRVADSQSMDKTTVFDNESIWVFEQIMEPLYTVTTDGKDVEAVARDQLHALRTTSKTYTFKLRQGVKFSNGQPMTSADVKFSIDAARVAGSGLGLPRRRDQGHRDADPGHGRHQHQVPVGAVPRRHRPLRQRDHPQGLRRRDARRTFYQHPIGTGPFMWDHWDKGNELVLKKNPNYWQKGKPYLDSVTWRTVGDDNTRELQLRGRPGPGRRVPAVPDRRQAQEHAGRHDDAVHVDAHGLHDDERALRAAGRRPRPPRDLATRSTARRSSSRCCSGTASRPTRSCRRRCRTTTRARRGLQYNIAQAKAEMAKSKYPNGFNVEMLLGKGSADEHSDRPDHPAGAQAARHQGQLQAGRPVDGVRRRSRSSSTSSASATGRWTSPTRTSSSPSRSTRTRRRALVLHRLHQPRRHQVDARGGARVRQDEAPGALHEDPEAGRRRRVHGVPLLLAVPVRVHQQAPRVLRVPDR